MNSILKLIRNGFLFALLTLFILIEMSSCQKDKKDPGIITSSLVSWSSSNYKASAKITEKGDYQITDYGFVYSVGSSGSIPYVTNSNKVSLGSNLQQDTFSALINPGSIQNYYTTDKCWVWAYITNTKGTIYGNPVSKDLLFFKLTSVSPAAARVGDTIVLSGTNFNTTLTSNSVKFNGLIAQIVSVTQNSLSVIVPAGISINYYYDYSISITVVSGNQASSLNSVFQLRASATGFSPNTGSWNTQITVYGTDMNSASLVFGNVTVDNYYHTSSYVSGSIPGNVLTRKFKVFVASGGIRTEVPGGYFTMDKMTVNSLSQLKYFPGSPISFSGTGFNPTSNYNNLFIGSSRINSTNSYSNLQFLLPATLTSGDFSMIVFNGIDSVSVKDKISIVIPNITGLSVDSGYPNSQFNVIGNNFFTNSGQNTLFYFGASSSYVGSVQDTKLVVTVPWLDPGTYIVHAQFDNIQAQSPVTFTILEPKVTTMSPASGTVGSTVIINGAGFEAGSSISVYFGNNYANIINSTSTQLNVQVPAYLSKGTWTITVYLNGRQLPTSLVYTVS